MATSFFGKLNPSRTQSNQRPKINIWNQRENTGPLTIITALIIVTACAWHARVKGYLDTRSVKENWSLCMKFSHLLELCPHLKDESDPTLIVACCFHIIATMK